MIADGFILASLIWQVIADGIVDVLDIMLPKKKEKASEKKSLWRFGRR